MAEDYSMTVGVQLLGHFLNTYLFGIVCYQFAIYYQTRFCDPLWLRLLMLVLFLLDLANSVVAIYHAWDMCVTNYTNPAHLSVISWGLTFSAVCNSVISILTQAFLLHRLYILQKNIAIIIFTATMSLLALTFGVLTAVDAVILREVKDYPKLNNTAIAWLTFQMAADVLITIWLSVVLARARTGIRATDRMVNRLIRGAVQTGLFATLFALGDLLSFVLASETSMYGFFLYSIGRIYTNTLLDSLLCRREYRMEATTRDEVNIGEASGDSGPYVLDVRGIEDDSAGAADRRRSDHGLTFAKSVSDEDMEAQVFSTTKRGA